MKMLVFLLLPAIFARADEISDRQARNAEQAAAESRAKSQAYRAQGNQERLIAFHGFINNHRGLVSGTCRIATEDCSDRTYSRSGYCPVRESGDADIRSLEASGEYIIRQCRVATQDGHACELAPDTERNSFSKPYVWQATCTPDGGDRQAFMLYFRGDGREYNPPPVKKPKEKPEPSYSYYRGYPGYGYGYGYGYGFFGGSYRNETYNCYGKTCNYYGGGKRKRSHGGH